MNNRCLYCYEPLTKGETDYHPKCSRKFFGLTNAPELPYSRDNISDLALQVIQSSTSITGAQAKISLDLNRGGKFQKNKLTIVGLWGKYILKPQSESYHFMPELEDLTMKMADAAKIKTVPHSLIRMSDGELAYITRREDRDDDGYKFSMLDMCQLSNRLTEHKYRGSYIQLADTIRTYSSAKTLDVQRFWEIVIFSWITGNNDMHCKNFSLINKKDGKGYTLSPAYDLLSVILTGIDDHDELAMTLTGNGVNDDQHIGGYNKESFIEAMNMSNIGTKPANYIIKHLISHQDKWISLINNSFLDDRTKKEYIELIDSRIGKLI